MVNAIGAAQQQLKEQTGQTGGVNWHGTVLGDGILTAD